MLNFIWEALLTWVQYALISAMDMLDTNLIYAFSPRLITMDQYFPFLMDAWDIIVNVAFAMAIALCIFKLFQNTFMVFTKNYENPLITILRTVFVFVVITTLPMLLKYLFEFADTVYWAIIEAGDMDGSGSVVSQILVLFAKTFCADKRTEIEALANPIKELADIMNPADNIAEFLLSFILTVAIVWDYFKLVLEIAERYVVLGVMYYTMPLAAVPLVSKDTSAITKSWLRMLISELMILVLNVWFIATFRMSIINGVMLNSFTVNGREVGSGILWCFIALAFLKTAQRIDSHIATLGLTTAQLGSGIADTLLASKMMGKTADSGIKAAKGVFSFIKNGGFASAKEARQAAKVEKMTKSGKSVTDPSMMRDLSKDTLARSLQNGASYKGDAGVEAVKNLAPELTEGKNIVKASADKNGFTATYKDANGKEATLNFSTKKPDGISKTANIAGIDGYIKDSGTPYSMDELNSGKTSFNEFADKHLNGNDNFISQSGHISAKDLDEATVTADENGDGFVIKDKDGFELAHVTPFNDEHVDGMTNNTLVGEGSDGLYRADINDEQKVPLPEGYSYAGEILVDDKGLKVTEESVGFTTKDASGHEIQGSRTEYKNSDGELVQNPHYQDSYMTPDGEHYISADDMNQMLKESVVSPSDYAGNLQYSEATGFVDNEGQAVDMTKTGWQKSDDGSDEYVNTFTGGTATGEQIAEHFSNPEYAAQSYGGMDNNGNELYFDNYTKESMPANDMMDERKYGEMPDRANGYYNPMSGDIGNDVSGPRNFGESIENLMGKDYSFTGEVGAKVAQTYMPDLKEQSVRAAAIDKNTIVVDRWSNSKTQTDAAYISRDIYWNEIPESAKKGTYQYVNSSGNQNWTKTYSGSDKKEAYGGKNGDRNDAGRISSRKSNSDDRRSGNNEKPKGKKGNASRKGKK